MSVQRENASTRVSAGDADATLRLIAELPVPEGLEDRVKSVLGKAPTGQTAKLLGWPARSWTQTAWARGAAAAAIVAAVAGGSWGVYARVQWHEAPVAIPHVGGLGGFSSANAVRTPKTLDVPTVVPQRSAERMPVKKHADAKKKTLHREKPEATPPGAK